MFCFRTFPYLKMKYSGRVCVRITLLVFPLFQTFFPYKFLNVFLRKVAWMPITKSLNTSQRGVVRNLSYLPPTLGCLLNSPRFYLRCPWNIFCRADDTSSNYCWLTTSTFRILWQVHSGSCHRSMSWNTITVKRPIISTEISIFH